MLYRLKTNLMNMSLIIIYYNLMIENVEIITKI